jgi:predicted outer membrane repeat protein
VQAGIDHAWGSGGEVWVAKGTYRPTEKADRSASFRLRHGVAVYGGFLGSETALGQRSPQQNETVLSGDIGKPGVVEDNCYHVLIGADQATVDGFTISGGNADGQGYDAKGGGMINYRRSPQGPPRGAPVGYSPIVRNCKFVGNRAVEGGAIYNYDRGTVNVVTCVFAENFADSGGAMVDRVGVKSRIDGCEFFDNRATWRGGALYLDYGARPEITRTLFRGNRSDCHGGAIYTMSRASQLENTTASLRDCKFAANVAKKRGGAISNFDNSMLTLEGCAFSGNQAGTGGGAVANDRRAESRVDNCTFDVNRASEGNGDIDTDASSNLIQQR